MDAAACAGHDDRIGRAHRYRFAGVAVVTMTMDQHLWACALLIEREHGESAYLYASIRADELDAQGAFEGARTWRAILTRIEALQCSDSAFIQ